jgi:hypothetical protein
MERRLDYQLLNEPQPLKTLQKINTYKNNSNDWATIMEFGHSDMGNNWHACYKGVYKI